MGLRPMLGLGEEIGKFSLLASLPLWPLVFLMGAPWGPLVAKMAESLTEKTSRSPRLTPASAWDPKQPSPPKSAVASADGAESKLAAG